MSEATFDSIVVITATEEVSHVDVFLGLLLLGLLFHLGATGTSISCGCGTAAATATGANIRQKLGDVLSFEGFGEEAGPVALYGVAASLDDLAEFFFLQAFN